MGSVCFDEENQIRILAPDNFRETEELEDQCELFVQQMNQFTSSVQTLGELLQSQAQKIDQEKLRAIGARNQGGLNADSRRRTQNELKAQLHDKSGELERLQFYYDTLEKVEREQKAIIDRLREND